MKRYNIKNLKEQNKMIVEHVRRQNFRRIDKKIKQDIEKIIAHHTDVDMVRGVKKVLNSGVDNEYLATFVAFYHPETNQVLVGFSQCLKRREDFTIAEDIRGEEVVVKTEEFDIFTRKQGRNMAEQRAYSLAIKNEKNSEFLPGRRVIEGVIVRQFHIPSRVHKNFARFMDRAKRYYKDKKFVLWSTNLYTILTGQNFGE
jgi:hypothetical protein